ncbi:MAG: hypothetical protein NC123_04170 [Butyrivibrio sp.]|nr:hypothetical protein [Butyrivibrio sp.]
MTRDTESTYNERRGNKRRGKQAQGGTSAGGNKRRGKQAQGETSAGETSAEGNKRLGGSYGYAEGEKPPEAAVERPAEAGGNHS